MAAPLTAPDALIRPWRTATLVASLIAAVELVLLIALAVALLAKPLAHAVQQRAAAAAVTPAKRHAAHTRSLAGLPAPRSRTGVLVLNGNGRAGAAHAEAMRLRSLGYRMPAAANAPRSDYATSLVMFRPGYGPAANRLARDLHVRIVGALDGLRPSALHGEQLVLVLGAHR